MQLNNYGAGFSSKYLYEFNCCWLSAYTSEDEYLFVGGHKRIKIETVSLKSNGNSYDIFFKALYYFHSMINGTEMDDDEYSAKHITKKCYKIIKTLILSKYSFDMDRYINDTWDLFKYNQKTIVLNLHQINEQFIKLKDLILDENNTFNDILFKLFVNVNHIIIYSSDGFGNKQYKLSLLSILST
eukprot:440484_1